MHTRDPAHVHVNIISLKTFKGLISPKNVEFHLVTFCIQFHNLPLGCMNQIVGEQISLMITIVQWVDENGIGWGKYLCIKVLLNVTQPLFQRRILIT